MTLIELTMSLAIVSFIAVACGSMVYTASKAMSNDSSNLGSDASAARYATSMVIDDLKMATAVSEQTATAITMTVPDRDGDGSPETIRYSWSGTAGDPLMRTYNSRTSSIVASNVRALNFTYLTKTVGKPPPSTTAEQSFLAHSGTSVAAQTLSSTTFCAGYFKPTTALTPSAPTLTTTTGWTVSRVQVQMQRSGTSTGTITCALYYADSSNKPTGAALQTCAVSIANILGTGQNWTEFAFSSPATLDASKGVCVVVSYVAVAGSGGTVFYDASNTDTSIYWTTSSDSGSTWATPVTSKAMQLKTWGTVTTQDNQTLTFQPLPPSSP
jgi:hypothetical protein